MEIETLSVLNPHPTRLPGPGLLHHLVAAASDSTAIEHLDSSNHKTTSYSYGRIHRLSNALASRVSLSRGHWEGPFVVPVLVRQSPELYIALLAVLKAGGAFCPLNPDDPPERISFILKDVSASVLVVSKELSERVPLLDGVQLLLPDMQDAASDHRENAQNSISASHDLAYVMYTSGSTGVPKGVGISHSAACQALLAHDGHIPTFSRLLQFAAPTFDISVFEIFFTLFRGCTLICVDRNELLDDLPGVLREMRVDACELTPTVAAGLLRTRDRAPDLKLLLTIGEMLNEPVVREFGGDSNTRSMLWAMYGPTEATIHCTLQPQFSAQGSVNNIGRPLDTVSCFVIQPAEDPGQSDVFQIVPRGEIGELALGGYQLAEGYLNRLEQNSASFISSPYGRIYRTGDRARITTDGTLECLGRLSQGQVKLRGQRLELGEVEASVLRTPGCHGAVATVLDSVLIAFCAVDAGVTEKVILGYCERWLPKYMVPGVVVLLRELPRLPSGKVDKKKLQSDFETSKFDVDQYEVEVSDGASDEEAKIMSIISEVLNVGITKTTTLALAGLDSLRVISLAAALRSAGFQMSVAQLLLFKTVSDLCSAILSFTSSQSGQTEDLSLSLLKDLDQIMADNPVLESLRDVVEDVVPCHPLQSAMLFETLKHHEAYWNDIELDVSPGISADKLMNSILEVINQNEILRTGFFPFHDGFASVIFKTFDQNLMKDVDAFHGLDVAGLDEILHPFRLQILDRRAQDLGPKILIHIHHAIYDGWSMDIFMSDISEVLKGTVLPPRQQFRRCVQSFNSITIKQSDDDCAFWSDYLLGWNKRPLPNLCNRPAECDEIQTWKKSFYVPSALVKGATMQTACSVQVYFQAALALVLSGIMGDSEVVLGSVLSGRTLPIDGIEGILGPCIASMPLRIDLARAENALDILLSIKASNRTIMEHISLPLSEIKKLVEGQTLDSLYDVLFIYQQSIFSEKREQNIVKETRHLDRLETKLLIEAEPHDDGFTLLATFHSLFVSPEAVQQMIEQIKEVFIHLLGHERDSVPSISQAIQTRRSIFNKTPQILSEECDLALLFEAAVKRMPQSDAISFKTSLKSSEDSTTTISFEALNKLSNKIANLLLKEAAISGDVVAIHMEKSPLLYASILGITKARCGYLPLLPSTPRSQVQKILLAAGITTCLGDRASLKSFQSIANVKFLDVDCPNMENLSDQNPEIAAEGSRLAYVVYDSLETGVPKGVAVTQRNMVSKLRHLASIYPRSKKSPPRLLQASSHAFGASAFEVFFAWHMGMCLCSASENLLSEDLERIVRDFRITHLSLTPSLASLIWPENVPDVEFLVTAGEPITDSVLKRWGDLLWQGYGHSETTHICSLKKMKRGENINHPGPIFPNTSVVVLAPGSLETLPLSWVGELCFGGDQVAAGYLNAPDLTAERFINHPEYGRIYRSGDMGRLLADGTLMVLAKIEDQNKLRGRRIDVREVSAVITGSSLTDEAVTIMVTRANPSASEFLASFYVSNRTEGNMKVLEVDVKIHQSLFATLLSWLPSYMVPSYLIPLSSMPLKKNGKIDRQRLQSCFARLSEDYLEASSHTAKEQDRTEWTEMESSIAGAISRSLDIPRSDIGRWTPFAKLGLHSISAIGVARDLRSRFSTPIPISALLQNPSVAQLSRFIATSSNAPPRVPDAVQYFSQSFIEEVRQDFLQAGYPGVKIYPCSPLQEAMLSHDQGAYHNKITLRLHIGSEKMRECWVEMVQRHDILRTCFVTTSDSRYPIAQVLLESFALPWKHINWITTETHSLNKAIQQHSSTISEPLESKAPPFSLALIQTDGDTFLSFVCHHALYDGVAMENLWREVEAMARGNSLPPPASYSSFLQEMLNLPQDVERFWIQNFWGYSSAGLFAQPSQGRIRQRLHSSSLELAYDKIEDQAQVIGVSLLSMCQAAWAQVLSICSKSVDVCFGCVMSGRTLGIDGIERLVAPCFNTVPVRKDFSHHSSNAQLAKAFQLLTSDLLQYQFTPLRLIQNKILGTDGRKLFDTLLILQMPFQEMDREIWTLEEDSGEMEVPLVCEVIPCPGLNTVTINMHYHDNLIDEKSCTVLASAFKHFFRSTLSSPSVFPAERNGLPVDMLQSLEKLAAQRETTDSRSIINTGLRESEAWTETELLVQEVFSDLSGVPIKKIDQDTSMFRLGLDSINAAQIASRLRRQGFAISASDVIEHHSCRELGERLLRDDKSHLSRPEYDLGKFSDTVITQVRGKLSRDVEVEAVIPCTPIQGAMLASFVQSNGEHYLNMVSYDLDEDVSGDSLTAAWKDLQSCHPMLRTGFVPVHHNDSSFAMVRYRSTPQHCDGHIQHLDQAKNLANWKKETASRIREALQSPPWRLAIFENSSGISMHLLIHHALYDATSLDSILAGLAELLRGGTMRLFPAVEPALRHILSNGLGVQDGARGFWEEKAESVVVNKFPMMTPLREQRDIEYHETSSSIAFSVMQRVTQEQGVSIQAVVQAAWTRILSSYLGEESVVFGVILSGRSSDETRDAPFPCLVTIPIVATHHQSNEEMVNEMMDYNRGLHKHQFVPLGRVQSWLGHPATRIFDTILVYQKMERDLDVALARPWTPLRDDASVDYPVSIEVEPLNDDSIRLGITYFSDILPSDQAQLLLRQFDAVMQHMAMEPTGHEDELYHSHPDIFAVTPAAMDVIPAPVRFLHQFVEQRVLSNPDDPALEFVGSFDGGLPVTQTWTFAEFDTLGNRVAHMLRNEASVGSIIAIHFEKCPEAYVSILGILKAGCSFVALDVGSPNSRKEFIVRDSQAPCLLASSCDTVDFVDFEETGCRVIRIGLEDLDAFPPERRDLGADFVSDATCYCLYTSGTTGTPKGCEISHENCVQAMMAFQDLFKGHWQSDSRWLQFAALHFDVSVLEQYWSWSVGITVVAAPRELVLDDLIGSIDKFGITHIDLTPSLARLTHPEEVPNLCKGVFITGGESLKQEILDAWGDKAVIYNAYGPTEATIGVTMYQRVPVNGRPSNIGRQFLNVGSYVFRKGTEIPVLRGSVGELCVSGKLVGKGYLNRPELTEERFPTLSEFGERIYRTGDLVRILHDGCFDFLGRADDQVKLRGQRLEIGEINHVIRTETPGIADVATLVMRRQGKDNQKDVLVSFIVGRDVARRGAALEVLQGEGDDLVDRAREACRAKLPSYMAPTYFLVLPFIPLSPNNKVEAKELKKLFDELSPEQLLALTAGAGAPSGHKSDTQTLKRTMEILAEFCHVDESSISESTSIFDLGVDSILALQLSTFFKKNGFRSCSPALLLRNPIIADLCYAFSRHEAFETASLVQESRQTIRASHHRHLAHVCGALGVQPEDVEHILPCSALQQGIISKSVTSAVPGLYFNSFEIELRAGTSLDRLKVAWSGLVAREAILRTFLVKSLDGYVQVALKGRDNHTWWRWVVANEDELQSMMEAQRQRWIESNNGTDTLGSPFEIVLLSGGSRRKLLIHIFHALYDGNSFDIMMRQVEDRYRYPERTEPQGPPFLEALCHGPLWRHDGSRSFWVDHLRYWKPSPVPRLSASQKEGSPVQVEKIISGSSLEMVRQKHNVTLQSIVMALWTVVLQEVSNIQDGITIGIIVSGRSIDLPNVENTIGPLFNTLPFFHGSFRGKEWKSVIRQCHDFHTSILPFQHVPLKSIQRWCSGGRPLFDNVFVFSVEHDVDAPESQLELWTIRDGPPNPDFPIALEVKKLRNGDLRLCLAAQGHIASVTDLEDILQRVERRAQSMEADAPFQANVDNENTLTRGGGSGDVVVAMVNEPKDDTEPFVWSEQALLMRNTIAAVSHVDEEDITATRTMLELGLDSVDIIQLSAKLRSRGVSLSASMIMRQQTISRMMSEATMQTQLPIGDPSRKADGLYEEVKTRLWKYVEDLKVIDMANVDEVLPPTHLQESMVAGMVHSDFAWYFNHDLLEVTAGTDIQRMQDAWVQLIQTSPILRTGFLEVEDPQMDLGYCQVVHGKGPTHVTELEIRSLSEVSEIIERATEYARERRGVDGLFQVKLVKCHGRRFFLVSIAHALYDGWSLGLMHHALEAAYHGETRSTSSSHTFLEMLLVSQTDEDARFWAGYLSGASQALIPDHHGQAPSSNMLHRKEAISEHGFSDISRFCQKRSVSLQTLVQACWAAVLAHRVRSLDVVFGVVLSGRDFEGAEDLMFPTMNTVPLRCILHGTSSDFLAYLEAIMLDVRDHQSYPLRKIQAAHGLPGSELFNSLFIMQRAASERTEQRVPLLTSVDGSSAVDYPVCVEAEATKHGLVWRVACQAHFVTEAGSAQIIRDLETVLGFLMSSPSPLLSFRGERVSICGLSHVELTTLMSEALLIQENETNLQQQWSEVEIAIRESLGLVADIPVGSIPDRTSLYHLGLDSISALKVCSFLRKKGYHINPRDLLKATSIAEMGTATRLLGHDQTGPGPIPGDMTLTWIPEDSGIDQDGLLAQYGISKEDVDFVLPALPMQVYMTSGWLNSHGSVFFPEFQYLIEGPNDVVHREGLELAWKSLVAELPPLRTAILATSSQRIPFLQLAFKHTSKAFTGTVKPLVDFHIGKTEQQGILVRLRIHHALYDGVSLPAVMSRLIEILQVQNHAALSATHLGDWASFAIQPTEKLARQARKAFWVNYLDGVCSTQNIHMIQEPDEPRVWYLRKAALKDLSTLRQITSKHGVTIQSLFLAAYAKTLAERIPVVFGIYLANRLSSSLPSLLPTLNLVPLKVAACREVALVDVARAIQEDIHAITSVNRERVGLWEIVEWTGVKIDSFVNFLSGVDELQKSGIKTTLMESEDGDYDYSRRACERMGNNPVAQYFPPAIDVEASVRDDALDIGVFGSKTRISDDDAATLVEDIIKQLS